MMAQVDGPAVAIFEAIKARLGISFAEITTRNRTARVTHARYLAMFLLRQEGWDNRRIATLLGRTQGVVSWAARCVMREPDYAADLAAIRETLAERGVTQ